MHARPIVCVRNDPYDNLGIAAGELSASGLPVERLDGFALDVQWPDSEEIGGLLVFGGEMNVDQVEAHPYLLREREMMQQAVELGVPVLGICLGAQLLARALGARVDRAPVRELGFKPVRLTEAGAEDALLGAFAMHPCVFQWHEDTFDLPEGAVLLATGDDVPNQAFRYGANAWGVQFHLEVDREGVEGWLRVAEASLPRTWGRSADEVRDELQTHLVAQQRQARELFARFGRLVRLNATSASPGSS